MTRPRVTGHSAAAIWRGARTVPSWTYPAIAGAAVLLLPQLGIGYDATRQIELSFLLALLVSGLNLPLGYMGQLSVGQPAIYAAGAYSAALTSNYWSSDILLQMLVGGAVAIALGLFTGIPGLRLGSLSLAMTSFFLVLLVPDIVQVYQGQTGGAQGLAVKNQATLFGGTLTQEGYYLVLVTVTILWFTVFRNLVASRHGVAFQLVKHSPVLASSVGISVYRQKVFGYALGALPVGVAGALFANLDLFVSPDAFDFTLATGVLAAAIFGGSLSVYGALLGAVIVEYGEMKTNTLADYAMVVFGAFLILGGVALRGGVTGLLSRLIVSLDRLSGLSRDAGPEPDAATGTQLVPIEGGILNVSDVTKTFGGLRALRNVSLCAKPGEITALIGPNGSGKTTLLNIICGYYRREVGSISLGGFAIGKAASHRIARRGIARTFQTPQIPPGISVRDTVASGRYARDRSTFAGAVLRTPGFRRVCRRDRAEVDAVLRLVSLDHRADDEAASLPLGMRRMVEIGRAVVAQPKVMLLDEVASGLDEHEVEVLADLIRQVRDAGCTIVLVEHNFDLVSSLADTVVVLARGSVLASGSPGEMASNPQVREEYLGIVDASDVEAGHAVEGLLRDVTRSDQGSARQREVDK